MASYKQTLDYLFSLQNSGIKLGLERVRALMALLDDPSDNYPTVLVAGTNGKGSLSAILASILSTAGFSVGLYTSPHLVRFNERIRVDGSVIPDSELVELTEKIRALVGGAGDEAGLPPDLLPTFFEFTTALALTYFKEREVDIAILEVGLGGRLDATNIVNPVLSLITSIGLDHVSSLGETIAQVAGEKGGIIKEDSIVICSKLPLEASRVIKRISRKRSAKLILAGEDFKVVSESGGGFHYMDNLRDLYGLKVALYGSHQQQNAGLAISALGQLKPLGFNVTTDELRRGLMEVVWPGRCELIRESPKVILDCAHNESAAKVLSEVLGEFTYKRLILVLGIMADKDIEAILVRLAPIADHIILTSPRTERAEKPEKLLARVQTLIEKRGLIAEPLVVSGVDGAVRVALDMADEDDMICVSGSLFTVGEAMSSFEQL